MNKILFLLGLFLIGLLFLLPVCNEKEDNQARGDQQNYSFYSSETSTETEEHLPIHYRVNVIALNLRSDTTTDSEVIEKLQMDTHLTLLEKTNQMETFEDITDHWLKVQTDEGVIGYVFGGYLEAVEPSDSEEDPSENEQDITSLDPQSNQTQESITFDLNDPGQVDQAIHFINQNIHAINNQSLKKINLFQDWDEEEDKILWLIKSEDLNILNAANDFFEPMTYTSLYYDQEDRLRKIIHKVNSVDYYQYYYEYFDEQGNLIFLWLKEGAGGGDIEHQYFGSSYFHMGNPFKINTIKRQVTYTPTEEGQEATKETTYNELIGVMDLDTPFQFGYHPTVDLAYKHYQMETRPPYLDFTYWFSLQTTEDEEQSNANLFTNHVNLRQHPNTDSEVLLQGNAIGSLAILNIGEEQTIQSYGTHPWLKVKYNEYNIINNSSSNETGWLYGAFVEGEEQHSYE